MDEMLTIMETRSMSKTQIQIELGKRAKILEALGMEHDEACGFISSVMNLGIAAQENSKNKN